MEHILLCHTCVSSEAFGGKLAVKISIYYALHPNVNRKCLEVSKAEKSNAGCNLITRHGGSSNAISENTVSKYNYVGRTMNVSYMDGHVGTLTKSDWSADHGYLSRRLWLEGYHNSYSL